MASLSSWQDQRDSLIRRSERIVDKLSTLESQGAEDTERYRQLDNEYKVVESQLSMVEHKISEMSNAGH